MNIIHLLDKLNFPNSVGLEGEEALYNKKTIMDAYLSVASLTFNRQLLGLETAPVSYVGLNSISAELPKLSSNFDLFEKFTPSHDQSINNKCMMQASGMLDMQNFEPAPIAAPVESKTNAQESSSQVDTDLDSYTKAEEEASPKQAKKGKRKTENLDIQEFIKDMRRRLLAKLDSCNTDKLVFKKRVKSLRKNAKVGAKNYRGSRYWGVSKNKSKWQVMITLNHYKEYNGGFDDEVTAARKYDKKSICTFGLKAKTNFDYSKAEVLEILREEESINM